MADFLTTTGTSHYIEKIILEATDKLTLVSPYLQISKTLLERLRDASDKGVQIIIIYGKDELNKKEKESLGEINNIELCFFENLHAKCYFNEKEMVITSMNMYEFSEKNNREMGVFITKVNDEVLFENAKNETLSIINNSEKKDFLLKENSKYNSQKNSSKTNNKKFSNRGYCIRCKDKLYYNPSRPYCDACFFTWSQFENMFYEEKVCHCCGENELTSMEKPECYSCYSQNRNNQNSNW